MDQSVDLAQIYWILELSGLILASILTSAFTLRRPTTEDWAIMPLSFIADFTALLLLGPLAMTLVAIAGIVTQRLTDSQRPDATRGMLSHAATVVPATLAAAFAYRALGGTMGHFIWPVQGVFIAAAVVVYCVVKSASAEILLPLLTKQSISRLWPKSILAGCPNYCVGASLAVGLVELIDHRMWEVVPVAAVPLYFVYRAYCAHVNWRHEERRRREVIDSLDHGMAVVDRTGVVTLWNDGLETMLGCPREWALGRSLTQAMPLLARTDLPRAIDKALANWSPQTLPQLGLVLAGGARTLQVRILPVAGGVTLLWSDVTEQMQAEDARKRGGELFALAAERASDGLWAFDLRSKEFFVSGQWRAMLGLPVASGIGRLEEWLDRVHKDDLAPLKASLEAHVSGNTDQFEHEHRLRHEDGRYLRFLCRGVATGTNGRRATRIAGSLRETTEHATAGEPLRIAAFLDPLTGLCNRAVFVEGLEQRLNEFKAQRGSSRFAALYLDLDRLKVVNDSLGHLVGDQLLTAVSRRLESCLGKRDMLARLGGDEFAILLNEVGDPAQANAVAFRIQEALSAPFSISGREVFTSASIGIAVGQAEYNNPDEIMRDADTALYHAKKRGKARHELFDADMHARELDRVGLENDLRHAVNENDFEVHYQPIVLLASGMCVGFESLIRWTRNGKPVSPVTFIPLAEELGIIEPLGTWVLQQACATFADWRRRFPDSGLDYITVNVSSRQLMQQNFLSVVERAVDDAGLKPGDLRLEITETALMDSPNEAAKLLRELREFGAKIYLDDFGCGYSSLSHLHKLPVDALKIDRSFVTSLLLPDRPAIVESILALARTMNTSVVAEGIEEDVQARELERLGCTHAQGYLFSRPLPTAAVEALLAANSPLGPKNVQATNPVTATGKPPERFHSSKPFEWPEEMLQSA